MRSQRVGCDLVTEQQQICEERDWWEQNLGEVIKCHFKKFRQHSIGRGCTGGFFSKNERIRDDISSGKKPGGGNLQLDLNRSWINDILSFTSRDLNKTWKDFY